MRLGRRGSSSEAPVTERSSSDVVPAKDALPAAYYSLLPVTLFRWLSSTVVGPRGTLRAYADDLAFVLHSLKASLPRLARAFLIIKQACRLTLKLRKCCIIPFGKFDANDVRAFLLQLVPTWSACQIHKAWKYLGVVLGPDGLLSSWHDPCVKYVSRCHDVRQLSLGFTRSAVLHNRNCLPLLQYMAQFWEPDAHTMKTHKHCIQLLLVAPAQAINHPMATEMTSLGLGTEFHDLERYSLAARTRLAMRTPQFETANAAMTEACASNNACLAVVGGPTGLQWYNNSVIGALNRAVLCTRPLVLAMPGTAQGNHKESDIQKELLKALRSKTNDNDVAKRLAWRAQRWLSPAITGQVVSSLVARRVRIAGHTLKCWGPSFAVVRMLARGVCTAARFQKDLPCVFGCFLGEDCQKHYVHCQKFSLALKNVYSSVQLEVPENTEGNIDWIRVLLCQQDPMTKEEVVRNALIADIFVRAHTAARHAREAGEAIGAEDLVRARMKAQKVMSTSAGGLYDGLQVV